MDSAAPEGSAAMMPQFLEMAIARHDGAKRGHLLYGLALVAAGLVLLALAYPFGFWPLGAVGVAAVAVSVFAFRGVVERKERVEGLEVLREEWHDLRAGDDADAARFAGLVKQLY
ncbi:MAG: hypothetical protein KDG89_10455 [Geminicoccaceae bacterium]|nr:hypothetical protein [Geminicoccaceae bacterium]